MRVLILCGGADTGGQGIRIRSAFARFVPEWDVRSVTRLQNYLEHDEDVRWGDDIVTHLYEQADVIHVRNGFEAYRRFEKRRRPRQRKPVVIQHHGSMWRTDHRWLTRQAREFHATQLVSTIDMIRFQPDDVEWLPSPHDLDELASVRASTDRDPDKVIIHHSPTNRRIKDTDLFEKVCDALMRTYPQVEARVVEKMPWRQNMLLKAEADIVYDQLKLGWGNNSLEAWAMGIPVVGGIADERAREMMIERLGALPVVEADADTLYARLEQLVLSRSARESEGARGLEYVRQWHDHELVAQRLVGIYERTALQASVRVA